MYMSYERQYVIYSSSEKCMPCLLTHHRGRRFCAEKVRRTCFSLRSAGCARARCVPRRACRGPRTSCRAARAAEHARARWSVSAGGGTVRGAARRGAARRGAAGRGWGGARRGGAGRLLGGAVRSYRDEVVQGLGRGERDSQVHQAVIDLPTPKESCISAKSP